MVKYLNKLVYEAAQRNVVLVPCIPEEVDEVKKYAGGKLPAAYIEFLQLMGRGTRNGFLKGSSCFIDEVFKLNEWANDLLLENNFPKRLTKNEYVFWMSQGYLFAFFKLDEGDDPPVYYYRENSGQADFVQIHFHFSGFLLAFLRQDPDLFKKK